MEDAGVLERRLKGDEDPEDLPLELLQSITNDFSEDRKIGRGGFGAVYKGVLPSGTIVAVKRIDVNKLTIDDKLYRREFNILRKINHRNVVRFLGFCSNSYKAPIEEDVPTGELPRNVLLSVDRHLVQTIVPGTRLTVVGIYSVFQASGTAKCCWKDPGETRLEEIPARRDWRRAWRGWRISPARRGWRRSPARHGRRRARRLEISAAIFVLF